MAAIKITFGNQKPALEVGQRAVNLYFNDALIQRIMCLSALSGPDVAPTIQDAQEAVGSYIRFFN